MERADLAESERARLEVEFSCRRDAIAPGLIPILVESMRDDEDEADVLAAAASTLAPP